MGRASDVTKVLTGAVNQIKSLTDAEIEALVSGEGELRFVPKELLAAYKMLRALTEDQLKLIATKEASVKFVPPGSRVAVIPPPKTPIPPKAPPPVPPSADDVRARLAEAASEAEAQAYLEGLKLKPPAAKALAKELDVPLQSRATVASTIDDIVKVFVRSRLTADAIRRY